MTVTTEAAIRDRIRTLMKDLIPSSFAADRFREFRNERAARFRPYVTENPDASWRLFQVRRIRGRQTNDVSNVDVTARLVTFEVVISYPHSHRAGPENALDRDDVMEMDQKQIERAIGREGYGNFALGFPNASWMSPEAPGSQTDSFTEEGDTCDFLVIRQTMRFYRSTT